MEKLLQLVKTNLSEELYLIEILITLSKEIGVVVLERELEGLARLSAKQQNTYTRLELTQQSQLHLINEIEGSHDFSLPPQPGIRQILIALDILEDFPEISTIDQKLVELKSLNSRNACFLAKQYSSITAYQHLLDMIRGVNKVYDRSGALRNVTATGRVEQQGNY